MLTERFMGEFLGYTHICLPPNSSTFVLLPLASLCILYMCSFVHCSPQWYSMDQSLFVTRLRQGNSRPFFLPFTHIASMIHVQRGIFCFLCWSGKGGELLLSGRGCKQDAGGQITAEIQKPTNI